MIGDEDTQTGENFEAAFDRLTDMASDQAPGDAPPAEEPAPVEGAQDAPPADAEAPPADAEAPPADAEAPPAEPPPAEPPPKATEDVLERLARMVAEKEHAVPPEQQIQQPQVSHAEPEYYTKEESEFLANYEKEWPDVSRAEAIRRRAEYKQLVGYVFQEVAKELSPLLGTVRTLSERTHLADLQSRVENYAQDRDAVIDWVGKQPAYLQAAYKHVIQQGTVDEVADLIARYRQDVGATRAAPAAAKPKTDLPAATKQAAAALAPVSSKRSAVIRGTDPNDFESAFEEFAGKL